VSSFDLLRQSASLPGNALPSSAFLRRVSSRAFLAASLASAASRPFSMIVLASFGFESRYAASFSFIAL